MAADVRMVETGSCQMEVNSLKAAGMCSFAAIGAVEACGPVKRALAGSLQGCTLICLLLVSAMLKWAAEPLAVRCWHLQPEGSTKGSSMGIVHVEGPAGALRLWVQGLVYAKCAGRGGRLLAGGGRCACVCD